MTEQQEIIRYEVKGGFLSKPFKAVLFDDQLVVTRGDHSFEISLDNMSDFNDLNESSTMAIGAGGLVGGLIGGAIAGAVSAKRANDNSGKHREVSFTFTNESGKPELMTIPKHNSVLADFVSFADALSLAYTRTFLNGHTRSTIHSAVLSFGRKLELERGIFYTFRRRKSANLSDVTEIDTDQHGNVFLIGTDHKGREGRTLLSANNVLNFQALIEVVYNLK